MNYCIVAFGIWLCISLIQWFVDGRKNYTGPTMMIDNHVLVATPTQKDSDMVETSFSNGKTSGHDAPVSNTKYA